MKVIILTPVLGQLFKKIKGIEPGLADNIWLQTSVPKTVTIYNPTYDERFMYTEQVVPFRHLYTTLKGSVLYDPTAEFYGVFDKERYDEPDIDISHYHDRDNVLEAQANEDSSDDEHHLPDYDPLWPIEMWALYHTVDEYRLGLSFDDIYEKNLREVSLEDHLDEGW
jgi:hypothetical protein